MITVLEEIRVVIRGDVDILSARQQGRQMAAELGFSVVDQVATATAISELARNIVQYAGSGELVLRRIEDGGRRGVMVVARDEGPGIANLERALQGGYSASGSLGLGLSGTRRLMDDFQIDTGAGTGTTVTVNKWRH